MFEALAERIGQHFATIAQVTPDSLDVRRDVEQVIAALDDGRLRVAEW